MAVREPAGAGGTPPATPAPASWRTWPLLAAGFLTAFGAHAGLVTPLGFAALSTATPASRLGQTTGAAEVGRELGDAGGPLLVGAIAGVAGLGLGIASEPPCSRWTRRHPR